MVEIGFSTDEYCGTNIEKFFCCRGIRDFFSKKYAMAIFRATKKSYGRQSPDVTVTFFPCSPPWHFLQMWIFSLHLCNHLKINRK